MTKRHMILAVIILVISNVALVYFVTMWTSEESYKKLSSQYNAQRKEAGDSLLVKQLLQQVSELQQQMGQQQTQVSQPQSNTGAAPNSPELKTSVEKMTADVFLLKLQVSDLKKKLSRTGQDAGSALPDGSSLADTAGNEPVNMEARHASAKREIERLNTSYENLVSTGNEDAQWSSKLEADISRLINTDTEGENIQLQDVKCTTELCKVVLADANVDTSRLISSLGNVSAYITTKENAGTGKEEMALYISKAGEDLPDIGE